MRVHRQLGATSKFRTIAALSVITIILMVVLGCAPVKTATPTIPVATSTAVPLSTSAELAPATSSPNSQPPPSGIRGVWVQASSLYTKAKVDQTIKRVASGGFNTIFASVLLQGQTLYASKVTTTHDRVEVGFNPLEYLVSEAHQRSIKVHAWFVVGNMGQDTLPPLLIEHPDWTLLGPDGRPYGWVNFARPEVRQFFGDLASEAVQQYHVDGVHLDYIRYPDPEWGFDPYSMETFQKEYGIDPKLLTNAALPAYGTVSGNPLTDPSTATVLATFSNGYPAVTRNKFGKGEAVLFNWEASQRTMALNSEILKRSLQQLAQPNAGIFLFNSQSNVGKNGNENLNIVKQWLADLGWKSQEVGESELSSLALGSVLILPGVYQIKPEQAAQMADFVQQGGGMIIIDGPTPSIYLPDLQAITGMQSRGKHFNEPTIITGTGEDPLIPTSQRPADLALFQKWDTAWKDFRREGVTLTVQEIQRRVHSVAPEALVSAVIPGTPESSFQLRLQDWPTWLKTRAVDLLVPLLYVDQLKDLGPQVEEWKPAMQENVPFVVGLSSFTGKGKAKVPKPPEQLLDELGIIRKAGIKNFSIFDLNSLTDEQLAVLAEDAKTASPP